MKTSIIWGLSALLCTVFVAFNVTVQKSYQGNESSVQLTLTKLAAQAQSGGEENCSCEWIGFPRECKEGGWGGTCSTTQDCYRMNHNCGNG